MFYIPWRGKISVSDKITTAYSTSKQAARIMKNLYEDKNLKRTMKNLYEDKNLKRTMKNLYEDKNLRVCPED